MSRFFSKSKSTCWLPVALLATAFVGSTVGCQSTARIPRSQVGSEVNERFGGDIGDGLVAGEVLVPDGVSFDDGLTDDEAVRVALWNNAAFQGLLEELGVSSAQLFDAGLIADPQFTIFFPLGPKQLEFTAFQAVDALWLQEIRIRAAELDLDRVSQTMVQNGLDVIRDVKIAHTNLLLAQQRLELAHVAQKLRREIATLARKRLAAGDISELEATTTQIDALQGQATAGSAQHDVRLAKERLRTMIGLTMYNDPIQATAGDMALPSGSAADLLATALAMRPDLRAAEIAIEVATERKRLAQNQFMNLDAVYDANGKGRRGYESGPGLRFSIPIFNRNQGGIAIADAQLQTATRQFITTRDRIALEVRTAHTQLEQAFENLEILRDQILPALKQAEVLARRNYENGGATYFLVLQTTGQYLDTRMREVELIANVRRAIAEIERSVGVAVERNSDLPNDLPSSAPLEPVLPASFEDKQDASDSVEQETEPQLIAPSPTPIRSSAKWKATSARTRVALPN
jgi:cobalt-zinc-cadmium efflux system outer membrane protein